MTKLNTFRQNLKKFLRGNLFPQYFTCLLCDIEIFKGELCADCLKRLVLNNGATCPRCGRKTAKSEICIECKAHLPAYDRALSPLIYDKGSADLIARFKGGQPHIAEYLSRLIAEKIEELPEVDGIVSVPMSARALRDRGYNQSELLVEAVSERTGIPVLHGAAEKAGETPAQKELTRAERLKNLRTAFKADKSLVKDKALLIIDDVMTTGATLDSLALTLKNAGARSVFAVAAASVEYKSTAFSPSILRK